jgi:hypothetical protein
LDLTAGSPEIYVYAIEDPWREEVLVTASHDHVHRVTRWPSSRRPLMSFSGPRRPSRSGRPTIWPVKGIFETDEELEEFLAYTYAARRADLA